MQLPGRPLPHAECSDLCKRYKHEAYRTSLAPSRLTWPTGQAWYHRSAGRTNLELKVRPQDKPGTMKEAQDTSVVSTNGQQGKPGATE